MAGKKVLMTTERKECEASHLTPRKRRRHYRSTAAYCNYCIIGHDLTFQINKTMLYMKGLVMPDDATIEQHLQAVTAEGHRRVVCVVVQASP
jgi:hypothetical protein